MGVLLYRRLRFVTRSGRERPAKTLLGEISSPNAASTVERLVDHFAPAPVCGVSFGAGVVASFALSASISASERRQRSRNSLGDRIGQPLQRRRRLCGLLGLFLLGLAALRRPSASLAAFMHFSQWSIMAWWRLHESGVPSASVPSSFSWWRLVHLHVLFEMLVDRFRRLGQSGLIGDFHALRSFAALRGQFVCFLDRHGLELGQEGHPGLPQPLGNLAVVAFHVPLKFGLLAEPMEAFEEVSQPADLVHPLFQSDLSTGPRDGGLFRLRCLDAVFLSRGEYLLLGLGFLVRAHALGLLKTGQGVADVRLGFLLVAGEFDGQLPGRGVSGSPTCAKQSAVSATPSTVLVFFSLRSSRIEPS